MKKLLLFLCLGVVTTALPIASDEELYASELAMQLLPAGDFKEALDTMFEDGMHQRCAMQEAGCTFLKDDFRVIAIHPDFPEWIIKAVPPQHASSVFAKAINVGRVRCAQEIAQVVEKYNLQHVIVPQKFLYHLPGTPYKLTDANYIVIAQKLELVDEKLVPRLWDVLNVEQEDELAKVIKKVGYFDVSEDNICFTTDGKIAFIDTEPHREGSAIETLFFIGKLRKKLVARYGLARLRELVDGYKDQIE